MYSNKGETIWHNEKKFQNVSVYGAVSSITKVDLATSDILNRNELHSKPTVVFNVHKCLICLTEKMTSKSVNSCGTVG